MIITTSTGPGGNGGPAVAANDAGVVVAAWAAVTTADCSRSSVRLALRRPGGSTFGSPVTLRGSGRPEAPSVAIGAGGDILVAWARRLGEGRTAIEARVRPGRSGLGPRDDARHRQRRRSAHDGRRPERARLRRLGRAVDLRVDRPQRELPRRRPARGRSQPSAAAQTLERVRTPVAYLPRLGPVLALAGTNAFVAWTGHDSVVARAGRDDRRERAVRRRAERLARRPATPSSGTSPPCPTGRRPSPGPAWTTSSSCATSSRRSARRAARSARPELVSDGALRQPSIALDPTTRRPTVTWPQRLGPVTSVATITAYVRASTRAQRALAGGEALGALADPEQHPALHHERRRAPSAASRCARRSSAADSGCG